MNKPMNQTEAGQTKVTHKADCKRVFKRYDMTCPRCFLLAGGAEPRRGWGDMKRANEAASLRAIQNHNCKESGCMPICTFGDW